MRRSIAIALAAAALLVAADMSSYAAPAPLGRIARAEGEVGLRQFFTRFPDVELAGPGTRRDTRVLGGWAELPVRLGAPVALPG